VALPRESEPIIDRTPPQNVELEMCVLGGIMLEPQDAFPLAADYLTRDSFYLEGHGLIFELTAELHTRGIPPDANSVVDELRARDLLDKAGGAAVVMGMLNSVPTAANVEYHARKIAEKAHLRNLIRSCTEVINECYRQERNLEQVLDMAESSILSLCTQSAQVEFLPLPEVLQTYWEKLGKRDEQLKERRLKGEKNPEIPTGLPTGFIDIDRMTGGLRDSELTIIAARPSMGKTALGLNIAHNIAIGNDIPVALFSLEMGAEQLAERLLCMGTKYWAHGRIQGVSTTMLQNPNLTDEQWMVLIQAYERLCAAPIFLDDSSLLTAQMLRSKARRLYAHHGVQLIIVDYLQLMTSPSRTDNRVQEVSEISRSLKHISRELKIPVIALSQLSRQVEARHNKRPQLSDLRESGAIEQDADVVMFIHRPDYYDERTKTSPAAVSYDAHTLPEADIIVAKNRNGPTGVVNMRFFKEITRFLDEANI